MALGIHSPLLQSTRRQREAKISPALVVVGLEIHLWSSPWLLQPP